MLTWIKVALAILIYSGLLAFERARALRKPRWPQQRRVVPSGERASQTLPES